MEIGVEINNLNEYVWATWYVDFKTKESLNSMQLYILKYLNKEGLKFGFDYGDRIKNDNSIVKSVIENSSLKFDIIENLNKTILL